jgi:WD40 repeat protein/tetratricopeptide (TPR) repeat protein
MEAQDFRVEIGAGGAQGYEVILRAPDGGEAVVTMRLPRDAGELEALAARVPDAVIASSAVVRRDLYSDERPVRQLGELLFDAVLAGDGRGMFAACRHQAAREGRQLRMVLQIRPPELARLPWEFLFDSREDDYVCLSTPLIRYPQVPTPVLPLRATAPLRILGMVARPGDQEALAAADEQRRLHGGLGGLEAAGQIELGWVAGQTWRDLRDAMRSGRWHVFHFIGHGGFDPAAGEGALALAGDDGGTYQLGAENLAMLLRGHPSLRLVVLNACETGRASALDPFSSVAGALIRRGLPAVLAMQHEITDQAALEFSRTFYESLASQLPVDLSLTQARQAILLALPGSLEWGTPVLYMHSLDGALFDLAGAPAPRTPGGEEEDQEDLYIQGLAALYTERWEEAVQAFRALMADGGGYKDSAGKLERARRGQRLASLYTAARGAADAGQWAEAIGHLEAVVAAEPGYRDAQALLDRARRDQEIAALRAEIAALHRAGQWQAVIAVGERLQALTPDTRDPDGLISSAHAELQAAEQARLLAEAYQRALRHLDASEWQAALRELASIQDTNAGYKDSAELAARARRELARSAPMSREPVKAATIRAPKPVNAVAFNPRRRRLALACDGRLALVADLTGREELRVRHGGRLTSVWAVAFDHEGRRLATGAGDKTARIWDAATGSQLLQVTHTGGVSGVAFSPDGRLLATSSADKTARIWDAATGRQLLQSTHTDWVRGVAFSPDGRLLAAGSADKTARIWDAATGRQLLQVTHTDWVRGVAFSPDGRLLAAGSADKTARIWDAATGRQLLQVTHTDWVRGVAFSPDGRLLATGSADKTARIWDAATGRQLLQVTHSGTVNGVAFSPDGRLLATGSGDKTARIWDAATGRQLLQVTHTGAVSGVAFSPDGRLLATGSADKTAQLWRLAGEDDG